MTALMQRVYSLSLAAVDMAPRTPDNNSAALRVTHFCHDPIFQPALVNRLRPARLALQSSAHLEKGGSSASGFFRCTLDVAFRYAPADDDVDSAENCLARCAPGAVRQFEVTFNPLTRPSDSRRPSPASTLRPLLNLNADSLERQIARALPRLRILAAPRISALFLSGVVRPSSCRPDCHSNHRSTSSLPPATIYFTLA